MFDKITFVVLFCVVIVGYVTCDTQYIPKRITRSSNGKPSNEEFEKFFLKASKSVPRIGRRGFTNDHYNSGSPEDDIQLTKYPHQMPPKRAGNKNFGSPFWSEIAQIYEYNPELPSLMEHFPNEDIEQGDDPSVYDANKVRYKKSKFLNYGQNDKEIMEYRIQPEIA